MDATDTKTCSACFEPIDSRASRCPNCATRQPDAPGFYRNVPGKLMGGVCAAVACQFDWDVTLVRVLFATSLAFTGGVAFWVYGAMWLMTPFEARGRSPLQRALDWLGRAFSPPVIDPVSGNPRNEG